MKLHGYYRSSAAFRVRIALNLKGLAYEQTPWHLRRNEHRQPDFLAINPQGLLPALEVDGTALSQSLAIIEYLDETRPDPALLPAAPLARARVRSLAQLIACDIHPIDNLRVLRYLRDPMGQDEAAVAAWYNHWIAVGFQALEARLSGERQTGRFCHGEQPGLADICLVPQVVNSRNYQLDLTPFPTIRRIFDACVALPEFEAAMPANQPDHEPG